MPRPTMDPQLRKINITLRLPKYLVDNLKQVDGYNNLVERLLEEHFRKEITDISLLSEEK